MIDERGWGREGDRLNERRIEVPEVQLIYGEKNAVSTHKKRESVARRAHLMKQARNTSV